MALSERSVIRSFVRSFVCGFCSVAIRVCDTWLEIPRFRFRESLFEHVDSSTWFKVKEAMS